jgi:hypothetical protein
MYHGQIDEIIVPIAKLSVILSIAINCPRQREINRTMRRSDGVEMTISIAIDMRVKLGIIIKFSYHDKSYLLAVKDDGRRKESKM